MITPARLKVVRDRDNNPLAAAIGQPWIAYCPCCDMQNKPGAWASFTGWNIAYHWATQHATWHQTANVLGLDTPIDYQLADPASRDTPVTSSKPAVIVVDEISQYLTQLGCNDCVGGYTPVGRHELLGLVYRQCTRCLRYCHCCQGTGLFPADAPCLDCLDEALAELGYEATFCHSCDGVTAVDPTPEVTA